MATVTTHFKATENVSTTADKVARSIHNIRESARDAVRPLKDLSDTVKEFAVLGGAVIFARQLYQGISQCESAFEKLHPEVANSAGSVKTYMGSLEGLKAAMGGIVSQGMGPFRAWLSGMMDMWAHNIEGAQNLRKELEALSKTTKGSEIVDQIKHLDDLIAGAKYALSSSTYQGYNVQSDAIIAEQRRLLQSYQRARENLIAQGNILLAPPKIDPAAIKAAAMEVALSMRAGINELQQMMGSALDAQTQSSMEANQAWVMTAERMDIAADKLKEFAWTLQSSSGKSIGWWGVGGGGWNPNGSGGVGLADLGVNMDPLGIGAIFQQFAAQTTGSLAVVIEAIVNPLSLLSYVFQGFNNVVGPALDQVIGPLIGILGVVGQTLGAMLVPILQALSPVIDALGHGFLWLYNEIIVPVGNGVYWLFAQLHDAALDFILFMMHGAQVKLPDYILVDALGGYWGSVGDILHRLPDDTFAPPAGDTGGGSSSSGGLGSSTTVQHPPDIKVYITNYGTMVGSGAGHQVGEWIVDEIKDYLGMGARVIFLEGNP